MLGKQVQTLNINGNKQSLSLDGLSAGVYLLRFTSNVGATKTLRVIKN